MRERLPQTLSRARAVWASVAFLSARTRIPALAGICAGVVAASAWGAATVDSVTISAAPIVSFNRPFSVVGAVSSSRLGETVVLERDDCGPVPWHPVTSVSTSLDGAWRAQSLEADANARFRARWRKTVSRPITVKLRPQLILSRAKGGGFLVNILAYRSFHDRTAVLQRFRPARNGWATIARARLKRSGGLRVYFSSAVFHVKARSGATMRAVLSARQAGPCYAAGFSDTLRVP